MAPAAAATARAAQQATRTVHQLERRRPDSERNRVTCGESVDVFGFLRVGGLGLDEVPIEELLHTAVEMELGFLAQQTMPLGRVGEVLVGGANLIQRLHQLL